MRLVILTVLSISAVAAFAQPKHKVTEYVPSPDANVRQRLEEWQDLKFGLMMHWGVYSQWGIVESWTLCPEDHHFNQRKNGRRPDDYFTYKQDYEQLIHSFNPVGFEPKKWADAAKQAGIKYVVFTTKHHDGFAMYDSKYTDYKITGPTSPFRVNPRANITKEIFNEFRAQGMWAGAYFSKPDWHSAAYWNPKFPPYDRNVNYDPTAYPEKWQEFVDFTHNQIMELMTDYGKVDILWLDGGWVSKKDPEAVQKAYSGRGKTAFLRNRTVSQDIRMDELVAKARSKQPGLLVVDRGVPGINQNYLTPENRVPEEALLHPWESCIITAGNQWSWKPNAEFMSARKAVHTLADVVAKGGNLVLNIAPGPDGAWPEDAFKLLKEIGAWMTTNGEAIYATRPIAPYKTGNIRLTRKKAQPAVYAIYLSPEGQDTLPATIEIKGITPLPEAKLQFLGKTGDVKWESTTDGFTAAVPEETRKSLAGHHAWSLKISGVK